MASLGIAVASAGLSSALGFGGAIGWFVGSIIGNLLFPPKQPTIRGPRLDDVTVQSAAHGAPIVDLHGMFPIAGHLIDSSDLKERAVKKKVGGKGGGGQTSVTFLYSFDGAVLICRGPIAGVRRVWADTKLIRDVSEDATLEEIVASNVDSKGGAIRFYFGTEDQLPDPLLEALHGVGNVPAYRGMAIAVKVDFQLADFANRIPNFQYEAFTNGSSGLEWKNRIDGLGSEVSWAHVDDNGEMLILSHSSALGPISNYTDSGVVVYRVLPDGTKVFDQKIPLPDGFSPSLFFANTVAGHSDELSYAYGEGFNDTILYFSLDKGIGVKMASLGIVTNLQKWAKRGDDLYVILTQSLDLVHWSATSGAFIRQIAGFGATDIDLSDNFLWAIFDGADELRKYSRDDLSLVETVALGTGTWKSLSVVSDSAAFVARQPNNTQVEIFKVDQGIITPLGTVNFTDILNTVARMTLIYRNGVFLYGSDGFSGVTTNIQVFTESISIQGVPLSEVVRDYSIMSGLALEQMDVSELTDIVDGYVRPRQMTGREIIGPLQSTYFFDAVESDSKIKWRKRGRASAVTIPKEDLSAHEFGGEMPDLVVTRQKHEHELPARVEVNYRQRDFDYEQGMQYDERLITEARNSLQVDLPISIADAKAKQVAVVLMTDAWTAQNQREVRLSRKYAYLEPTDVFTAEIKENE